MPPTIVQFMHDMTFENTGPELELLGPKWESNWMWTGNSSSLNGQTSSPKPVPPELSKFLFPGSMSLYVRILNLNHCLSQLLSHPH